MQSHPSLANFNETLARFKETKGDLFKRSDQTDALAHCISEDICMGAGIALQFRNRYGGIKELRSQQKRVGEVAYLRREGRYIFYMITKYHVHNKPYKDNFFQALFSLRICCEGLGVKGVSMPRIGTGLDGLPLDFVHDAVKTAFEGSDINVTMFYI